MLRPRPNPYAFSKYGEYLSKLEDKQRQSTTKRQFRGAQEELKKEKKEIVYTIPKDLYTIVGDYLKLHEIMKLLIVMEHSRDELQMSRVGYMASATTKVHEFDATCNAFIQSPQFGPYLDAVADRAHGIAFRDCVYPKHYVQWTQICGMPKLKHFTLVSDERQSKIFDYGHVDDDDNQTMFGPLKKATRLETLEIDVYRAGETFNFLEYEEKLLTGAITGMYKLQNLRICLPQPLDNIHFIQQQLHGEHLTELALYSKWDRKSVLAIAERCPQLQVLQVSRPWHNQRQDWLTAQDFVALCEKCPQWSKFQFCNHGRGVDYDMYSKEDHQELFDQGALQLWTRDKILAQSDWLMSPPTANNHQILDAYLSMQQRSKTRTKVVRMDATDLNNGDDEDENEAKDKESQAISAYISTLIHHHSSECGVEKFVSTLDIEDASLQIPLHYPRSQDVAVLDQWLQLPNTSYERILQLHWEQEVELLISRSAADRLEVHGQNLSLALYQRLFGISNSVIRKTIAGIHTIATKLQANSPEFAKAEFVFKACPQLDKYMADVSSLFNNEGKKWTVFDGWSYDPLPVYSEDCKLFAFPKTLTYLDLLTMCCTNLDSLFDQLKNLPKLRRLALACKSSITKQHLDNIPATVDDLELHVRQEQKTETKSIPASVNDLAAFFKNRAETLRLVILDVRSVQQPSLLPVLDLLDMPPMPKLTLFACTVAYHKVSLQSLHRIQEQCPRLAKLYVSFASDEVVNLFGRPNIQLQAKGKIHLIHIRAFHPFHGHASCQTIVTNYWDQEWFDEDHVFDCGDLDFLITRSKPDWNFNEHLCAYFVETWNQQQKPFLLPLQLDFAWPKNLPLVPANHFSDLVWLIYGIYVDVDSEALLVFPYDKYCSSSTLQAIQPWVRHLEVAYGLLRGINRPWADAKHCEEYFGQFLKTPQTAKDLIGRVMELVYRWFKQEWPRDDDHQNLLMNLDITEEDIHALFQTRQDFR